MNSNVTRGIRALLFLSLLGVLGFKGDACICGGPKYHPPPPPQPTSTPTGSSSATPAK